MYGLLGPARNHVQQAGRTTAVVYGGQVNDHGDIAVALPGVVPHIGGTSRTGAKRAGGILDSEDLHAVEAVGIV